MPGMCQIERNGKNVASLTTCVAEQKQEHNDICGDLRKVCTQILCQQALKIRLKKMNEN